ncbi:MAG: polysaccharide deacetylase [Candidatus Hydrogenedentota bacterium]|nr:MAG: polysaccharide deacetylase [Candidatus Hydrogenedentota bacterium]
MDDKKCAVVLSFDFDAESMWISLGLTTPTPVSRGEYGARVAVPRILALLDKYTIRATFFVPADTVRRHGELVREIHARGHEIGHHGDVHESPAGLGLDEERKILETGIQEIENAIGEPPKGYRSPAWDLSPNSIGLFQEYGFMYDSSMMGDDFRPYLLRHNGKETNIVEIPVSWELDDAPHFLFNFVPYLVGTSAPSKVYEIWAAEFEGAYLNQGIFTLTMHPQIIGRYHRLKMLEKLIEHTAGHSGVWFATCSELAADWLKRHK